MCLWNPTLLLRGGVARALIPHLEQGITAAMYCSNIGVSGYWGSMGYWGGIWVLGLIKITGEAGSQNQVPHLFFTWVPLLASCSYRFES